MFKVYIQTSTFQEIRENDLEGMRLLQVKGGDAPVNVEHLHIYNLFRHSFPSRLIQYEDITAYEELVTLGYTVS